jgi:exopolyphosphatase/guanosine-5'-triphosphate,3'-diphosphate pyrophosphatase
MPKDRHEHFQVLAPEERIVVRRLAALLRVADGLDRGHRRSVRSVQVVQGRRGLHIDVFADEGGELEIWAAQQKADLLAEVAGGPVVFKLHR